MIAWVDLETSGLEDHDRILEVACIVTDDSLTEVARFQAVTSEAQNVDASKVDEKVMRMHLANGLWQESLVKKWTPIATASQWGKRNVWCHTCVDNDLMEFIAGRTIASRPATIAGSSVWFDFAFLKRYMPETVRLLDRHLLDTATMNEFAKRAWPELYKGRPQGRRLHRAMPDIEDSLALARYYATNLGPVIK